MIRLAQPAFLSIGVLLILPYLLRPQRAWQYSNVQLLLAEKRTGVGFLLIAAMTIVAMTILLIALARPQMVLAHAQRRVDARDIIIVLDLSLSMEGHLPSHNGGNQTIRKLDVIQRAALAFVKRHQHDRLGLIVFGDEAFGAWPLSTDSTTLRKRLQDLDILLPPELRGTHVENALIKSLDHMLELGQAQTKIIMLLTDGLDTINPETQDMLLQRLRHEEIKLYVLGLQLPKDSSLVRFTHRAQGRYYDINKADELAHAVLDVERLEQSTINTSHEAVYKEIYPFFAFPGLTLLLGLTIFKSIWVLDM